jgi:MFS transporter, OFA family, oxalate/formate antiporter
MSGQKISRGWVVTLAGTGINLALGILYTWSVIKKGIPAEWGWGDFERSLPYSVALLVFAFATVVAGRLQDRVGPRWVATAGGVLIGLGCLVAGLAGSHLAGFVLGFGVLGGIGIGFGYASATPPAVKWFPGSRTGMVTGIVVAGFGLASVYTAPLSQFLLTRYGVSRTMMILAGIFFVVVTLLSRLLANPPAGYVPPTGPASTKPRAAAPDVPWRTILVTGQFWVLWWMFFLGAGVGLVLIGSATEFVPSLKGAGFLVVVVMAVGNASGRVLAGTLSDRIGRQTTLLAVFLLQAVMVLLLLFVDKPVVAVLAVFVVAGGSYGANLALFPAAAKDYFGLKGFGLNYGMLFTAWGVGGFILSQVKGYLKDTFTGPSLTGTSMTAGFQYALILAVALLLVAASLTFVSRTLARRSE